MTKTKAVLLIVLALIVGFLVGFGIELTRANGLEGQLQATRSQLELQRLEATLGAATIAAEHGEFEMARQTASTFFTGLQAHVGEEPGPAQPAMHNILSQRDAVITMLSRSDSQSGSILSGLFADYRAALGERPSTAPVSAPGPSSTTPATTTPATTPASTPDTPATTG